MSIHSCKEYCDIDDDLHDILKWELDESSCWWSKEELLTALDQKIGKYVRIREKLAKYKENNR